MIADSSSSPRPLKVALLGCGVVGSEIARIMTDQSDELERRVGARLQLAGIAVRRMGRDREVSADPGIFTTDARALVTRPDIDIVIEVIGGIEPARELILAALDAGASVVTANKALLAEDGDTLYTAAAQANRDLDFEAAVAGAIPIVRPLSESLAGDRVDRVVGIVNGTTNYILDAMSTTGAGYSEALEEAQRLGYAEADPTADVEGFDAASKAAILAGLAFHTPVTIGDVYRDGIAAVTAADIRSARERGSVVKLLAICERHETASGMSISARVHPAMIPETHPLASVRGAYNAVYVESHAAGELMFYGPGAGGAPTASAVLGDVVSVARNRLAGVSGPAMATHAQLTILGIGAARTRYHISLDVDDRPGVLATVAQAFAQESVSIKTVIQDGYGGDAQLVIVTHEADDSALAATVERLRELSMVRGVTSVMRVEGSQA